MNDEIDHIECYCPTCRSYGLNSRHCSEITCEDGYIDESDEDYCLPGTVMVKCSECQGTRRILWCPNCGADLTGMKLISDDDF